MLSPSNRVVLLPCDREIIELAGLTESEYREFVRQCRFESKIRPGTPVAIDPVTLGIILVVAGAAIYTAGVLLAPKPKSSVSQSGGVEGTGKQGQNIVDGRRFAPKAGFDSLQNVVELGSTVPLIYSRRETFDGVTYGGVRVNTNLLWSQVLSLGGDQLLRSIYLVGEGDERADSMELDVEQFALGNNLLGSYDLDINDTSRVSIYYSNDDGRIVDADHVAGRTPANDPGNSQTGDVFAVRGANGAFGPNFSYAFKPTTQTQFGLFGWIGNGMCYRVNPSLRPQFRANTRVLGNGNLRIVCDDDGQENVTRQKQNQRFSGQSGITAGNQALAIGDQVTYRIDSAVSFGGTFTFTSQADAGARVATLTANDVNTSVAARQASFDENIVLGELYKIGSALCVCTARTGALFESQAENGNQSIDATFECVREGQMSAPPGIGGLSNATLTSQIFRLARGSFVTEYPTQVMELGIRSTVGIRVSGLTNTIEGGYTYDNIDAQACPAPPAVPGPFPEIGPEDTLATQQYNAGSVQVPEDRYSYFKILFRNAGTDDAYTELEDLYGIRSETSAQVYSYIRFEMPATRRYEFLIEPVSGFEIRAGIERGGQFILDHRTDREIAINDPSGVTVRFRGSDPGTYRMRWVDPLEQTLEWDDQSMADAAARLAEVFCYGEITTTVGGNPEHEIVYVNTILPNPVAANYENLAILGMNIRASREFANLSQLSVYMNRGLGGFHDFPSVLRDLLTNTRYGLGEIISPEQIDDQSFQDATLWTVNRRYFFDQAIDSPLNMRQWATTTARHFLLDLIIRNGQWALEPLVELQQPEPITGIFTAGNIIEDSFELNYFDQDQRQLPRISVKWRQEATTGDLNNRGLFPVIREVTVAETTAPVDAPREEIDLSDFCTSQLQAIDRAKFECLFRRFSTHSVKFKTTTDQAALDLGKCFKLGLETLAFDQPQNGYISREGTVTSWPEIGTDSFQALVWDGTGQSVQEVTLDVIDNRCATNRGSVFCRADAVTQTQTYKVQALAFDEDGNLEVDAIHWPTDADGNSLIRVNFADANFTIEGEV
jgi:hypothetical protein